MATPSDRPEPARFLVGILASGREALDAAARALEAEFGPSDLGAAARPFTHTDYYREELGPAPLRAFLAFPGPFPTGRLAAAKLATNRLEAELALRLGGPWARPANLDPGYLTPAKLVLASAKNFSHRIHLSRGIFAEVTLQYRGGTFFPLPWTFPDYASGEYFPFLLAVRERVMKGE